MFASSDDELADLFFGVAALVIEPVFVSNSAHSGFPLLRLELKSVREEQKKRETQAVLPVEAEPMVTETRCTCLCQEHHNLHQLLEDSLRLRGNICESK